MGQRSPMDHKPRVAVVDDDQRLRTLIEEELIDEGVHPVSCRNGQELLDLLDREQIDLILMDIMMPGMDGLTCLSQLRERGNSIPVLMVTALNDEVKRKEAEDHGATDYILKPDLFERLPALLQQHLQYNLQPLQDNQTSA